MSPEAPVDEDLRAAISSLPARRSRPEADLAVQGSWHLHRTDAEGEWTVHADAGRAWVEEGHSKGDCAVRGDGAALLAYLRGQAATGTVQVFGDEALAAAFTQALPLP